MAGAQSAPYRPGNLFDRLSSAETRELHYAHAEAREQQLLARRLPLAGGEVLSVGCGWNPGRHLFPAPAFRMVAVDSDAERVAGVLETGRAEEAFVGEAGSLPLADGRFDVVLYRLVLHHIAYQGPLTSCFAEAARLLKPGGALVAVEPGRWHPVGALLALANARGGTVATALHGTPDDIPLSPRVLAHQSLHAGLRPELHAVTYTWRRLPAAVQRAVQPLDALGSRPRAAPFAHTLMLIARKP